MTLEIDPEDPCGAVKKLRAVYYNIIAGSAAMIVTFRAGPSQVERSVTYHKADAQALLKVIREFEAKCAVAQGISKPRRSAIYTGGVRR